MSAESYLDCGDQSIFANADVTDLAAAPDPRPAGPLPFCRPFHEDGPLVTLVRARLRDRAEGLGWCKVEETFAGLHLVADGRMIRPDKVGLVARFVLPVEARDVRLVSATSVPAHVRLGSSDDRRFGLPVSASTIVDGLTGPRTVALADACLGEGFHAIEGGARWTDGSAMLRLACGRAAAARCSCGRAWRAPPYRTGSPRARRPARSNAQRCAARPEPDARGLAAA